MAAKSSMAKIPAEFKRIKDFDGARNHARPEDRLREIRKRAHKFRERFGSSGQALFYKTCDLIRVPYPTKYGLLNAFSLPTPMMHILNRLFIVRYLAGGKRKTLLFSPSDHHANGETPFFKRLSGQFGPLENIGKKFLGPILSTVDASVAAAGIRPEEVDYISYDHLHTQDVRKWLGSNGSPGYFPNAKLLVMRQEWDSAQGLLPPQNEWYCPRGTEGLDHKRVVLLDGDYELGRGVALVRSPGHTEGNHSLVVNTTEGVLVSSENGVSADNYAPMQSRIAGVRKYAKNTGMEVILNGNTLEGGLDQYISMVMEKEIAGPSRRNPDFYNVVPSSELASYWAFPGVKPTFSFGPLEFGSAAALR